MHWDLGGPVFLPFGFKFYRFVECTAFRLFRSVGKTKDIKPKEVCSMAHLPDKRDTPGSIIHLLSTNCTVSQSLEKLLSSFNYFLLP